MDFQTSSDRPAILRALLALSTLSSSSTTSNPLYHQKDLCPLSHCYQAILFAAPDPVYSFLKLLPPLIKGFSGRPLELR